MAKATVEEVTRPVVVVQLEMTVEQAAILHKLLESQDSFEFDSEPQLIDLLDTLSDVEEVLEASDALNEFSYDSDQGLLVRIKD